MTVDLPNPNTLITPTPMPKIKVGEGGGGGDGINVSWSITCHIISTIWMLITRDGRLARKVIQKKETGA